MTAAEEMINSEDVGAVHNFLQDFSGDFQKLFAGAKKEKKKRRRGGD